MRLPAVTSQPRLVRLRQLVGLGRDQQRRAVSHRVDSQRSASTSLAQARVPRVDGQDAAGKGRT